MAIQKRNDENVALLGADFQNRYESSFAWRTACSMNQALTGLRGFWPTSAFASNGNCYDQSGNVRTLTYNGNPVYDFDGLAPYIRFDGTGDYLMRADEAGLDILGTETFVAAGHRGLTLGGWFRPERTTATESLISKWAPANFSYVLQADGAAAGDPVVFYMSNNGVNTSSASSTTGFVSGTWQFMAGRFNPSPPVANEEVCVWINDEKTAAASAMANIFNGNADFNISGQNSGTNLFYGRASMCFLCAAALSDAHLFAIYEHTRSLFKA